MEEHLALPSIRPELGAKKEGDTIRQAAASFLVPLVLGARTHVTSPPPSPPLTNYYGGGDRGALVVETGNCRTVTHSAMKAFLLGWFLGIKKGLLFVLSLSLLFATIKCLCLNELRKSFGSNLLSL